MMWCGGTVQVNLIVTISFSMACGGENDSVIQM